MKVILNIIWLVLCGLWMAIAYAIAGVICFILIITIPFGIASFRIANYVLWPFGRTIEPRHDAGIGNPGKHRLVAVEIAAEACIFQGILGNIEMRQCAFGEDVGKSSRR